MAMNTKADIQPITIHNLVVDNNMLLLEFSSSGMVLETVKYNITYNFINLFLAILI